MKNDSEVPINFEYSAENKVYDFFRSWVKDLQLQRYFMYMENPMPPRFYIFFLTGPPVQLHKLTQYLM